MSSRSIPYGVALLLSQALVACSPGESVPANVAGVSPTAAEPADSATPAADTRLVVAFGDSLYAGYGVLAQQSFPAVLQRALADAGVRAEVRNAGVSGDTSAAGRRRLAFALDGLDRKPDLVIVGLGGNDMLRGLPPAETRANLTAILDELRRREIPTMLTGMIAAPNMGADYARDFNAIFPELAEEYGIPLDPFFLDGVVTDTALMLPDRIHPNPQGIERIVDRVTPRVATALRANEGAGASEQ
ncbi:arylesterase [Sphingomonas baiyangensis]|uniref:Arylesterase n=1 Tax=Sphingomonas baiyangensis TaxID=2572576 RepID=A0A4U1L2Y0_9SPHN|nr:arylesterase [Sphingomonas baiyangensis]TKD50405.1 arylesterase [Sphingomonas baiyangensis]